MRNFSVVAILLIIVGAVIVYYVFQGWRGGARRAKLVLSGRELSVEIVETPLARAQGLSGRAGLEEGSGMLFLFDTPGTYGFWMKDMRFPIDIIWIAADRVVGVSERVTPEPEKSVFRLTQYYPPQPVDRVLELNAGSVERYNFHIGDLVRYTR